jgi:hypothetical protein
MAGWRTPSWQWMGRMPWRDRRQQLRGEPNCDCEREENRLDEGAGEGEVDREDGHETIARGMPRSSTLPPDFDGGVIDHVVSVPLALLRERILECCRVRLRLDQPTPRLTLAQAP